MIDASTLTKRYYTISEVSEMLGVANSMLRYWEGEFKSVKPRKDRGGIRRYTVSDILQIQDIYVLLKERGFTIEGARKELQKSPKLRSKNPAPLKSKLSAALDRLKGMRAKLDKL